MIPVAAWLVGAAAGALYQVWRSSNEPKQFNGVGWSGSLTSTLPQIVVRGMLNDIVTAHGGFRRFYVAEHADDYFRGDNKITSLPASRDVRWREVPMFVSVWYAATAAGCNVDIKFAAPPEMTFNEGCLTFFQEHVKREYDEFFELLNNWPATQSRSSPPPPDPKPKAERDVDLGLLGLSRDASWDQAQAAYREACKKFHPDRLSGKDLPPELVAMAAKRFTEMTDAYQRLKATMGK